MIEPVLEKEIINTGLGDICDKVLTGKRLNYLDGLRLFVAENILAVGALANIVRERLHGNRTYFIRNQHINYSNICINGCFFCAFSRKGKGDSGYEMSLEEIFDKVKERLNQPITEIHIVGGLNPNLPYGYYTDMLKGIKRIRKDVHIQAFTCVEIAFIAEQFGKSVEDVLIEFREAGLGSIPGGGAEVFSTRVRGELCSRKLSPAGWLFVAKTAHRLGIRTNATMLYGHIENLEERVEHLIRLRSAQDESGGFVTFIPLAFHPDNTRLYRIKRTTGIDDLKTIAVSRLLLDNFPHIKPFWIMIGPKMSQLAQSFGANDMDGTVIEEKITHMAGAETAEEMAVDEIVSLIRGAGRIPIERDTLYNEIKRY
ncbi:MAG: aminofutalosine synthase MqnE [Acidobacteriota bacterium]